MAGIESRVATTGGALVRGHELNVTGGRPQGAALEAFKARIGEAPREQFELRLVSRGAQKFLQLREKTTFGALKAFFSSAARERQSAERRDAAAMLEALMPQAPTVQRLAAEGLRPLQPRLAAPAPPPPLPPATTVRPLFNPQGQGLQRPADAPANASANASANAPAVAAPSAAVPPAAVQAKPSTQSGEHAPIEKPRLLLKWELVASRKTELELHETLSTSELFRRLADGGITERTYLAVLKQKRDRGQLNERDYAFCRKHGVNPLPDQSAITLEKQRAVFVRDQLQAELFGDLKVKFLSRLVFSGEISERAYTLILKKQLREKRIDEQVFNLWKNPDVSAPSTITGRARLDKLAAIDLGLQVRFRQHDLIARQVYKDEPLSFLSDKLSEGSLNDYTYEAILESQQRRGLITDTQLMLWRNG